MTRLLLKNLIVIIAFSSVIIGRPLELHAEFQGAVGFRPGYKEPDDVYFESRNGRFIVSVSRHRGTTLLGRVLRQAGSNVGRMVWLHEVAGTPEKVFIAPAGEAVFLSGADELRFYKDGRLSKTVSLKDLSPSAPRYIGINLCGYLLVATVEGKSFFFAPATGERAQPKPGAPHDKNSPFKSYRDDYLCFEFSYPEDMTVKALLNPEGITISFVIKGDGGAAIDGSIREAWSSTGPLEQFGAFVKGRIAASFEADGHDGSTYAKDVFAKGHSGIDGIMEFEVIEVSERYQEGEQPLRTERTVSPIYAARLSQEGEPHASLVFMPSDYDGDGGKEALGKIIKTLRLFK